MEDVIGRVKEAYRLIVEDKTPKYARQPLPCELDAKVVRLIRLFQGAPELVRRGFFTHNNQDFSWILIVFAERMASLAVRENSAERIIDGLLALIIEDQRVDLRESTLSLAVLYDAATKIGASPDELFLQAASLADNKAAQAIVIFTRRTPLNKSLRIFSYKEEESQDGFRYVRTLWQL